MKISYPLHFRFRSYGHFWKMGPKFNTLLYANYLIFACVAYTLMFRTYLKSRRNCQTNNYLTTQITVWKLFKNSNFYISTLLVATYFVFMVIPRLTQTIYYIDNNRWTISILYYYMISARVSYLVDALIYIYLQKPVRQLFFKTFNCGRSVSCLSHCQPSNAIHRQNQEDVRRVEGQEMIHLRNIASKRDR